MSKLVKEDGKWFLKEAKNIEADEMLMKYKDALKSAEEMLKNKDLTNNTKKNLKNQIAAYKEWITFWNKQL